MSGTMGRSTPTMRATCGAHCPAAFTTHSVRMAPPGVTTSATPPRESRRMPVTRVPVWMLAPRARARRASSVVIPVGSR
jgi:hypothetical protein